MAVEYLISCDLRDDGEFNGGVADGAGGGSHSFVTGDVYMGEAAIRLSRGSGVGHAATTATLSAPASSAVIVARFLCHPSSNMANNGIFATVVQDSAGRNVRVTRGGAANQIKLRAGDGGIGFNDLGTVTLPQNIVSLWHLVEVSLDASNGDWELRVIQIGFPGDRPSAVQSVAGNSADVQAAGLFSALELQAATAGESVDFNQVIWSTGNFSPGTLLLNKQIQTLRPDADDSITGWTDTPSAGAHFEKLDDAPFDLATYISRSSSNVGDVARFTLHDGSSPNAGAAAVTALQMGWVDQDDSALGSGTIAQVARDGSAAIIMNSGGIDPGTTATVRPRNAFSTGIRAVKGTSTSLDTLKLEASVSSTGVSSVLRVLEMWILALVDTTVTRPESGSGADAHVVVGSLDDDIGSGADAHAVLDRLQQEAGSGADAHAVLDRIQVDAVSGADAVAEKEMSRHGEAGAATDAHPELDRVETESGTGADEHTQFDRTEQETGAGADDVARKDLSGLSDAGEGADAHTAVGVSGTDRSSGPPAPGGGGGSGISRSRAIGGV